MEQRAERSKRRQFNDDRIEKLFQKTRSAMMIAGSDLHVGRREREAQICANRFTNEAAANVLDKAATHRIFARSVVAVARRLEPEQKSETSPCVHYRYTPRQSS